MNPNTLLDEAIASIKNNLNSVSNKYEQHIREKAVEEVNKKIDSKNIKLEQIDQDDYEAMISDLSKDIKENYAKKASQGLLAFIGLDLLLG